MYVIRKMTLAEIYYRAVILFISADSLHDENIWVILILSIEIADNQEKVL
jgi:hypothetical protein